MQQRRNRPGRDNRPNNNRQRNGPPRGQSRGEPRPPRGPAIPTPFSGVLEFDARGNGRFRNLEHNLVPEQNDVPITASNAAEYRMRAGCFVEGITGSLGLQIDRINGLTPEEWFDVKDFGTGAVIAPTETIRLLPKRRTLQAVPTDDTPESLMHGITPMRIVELFCPIGKGQRALIVSPPKAGKTILMQQLAHAISKHNPDIEVLVLLIDERPEEVTDMRRTINGRVFSSSNDSERGDHVRLAQLVLEYAKRKVETGKDVVLLLDSLTRMGRAFNIHQQSSGRTMSGGVDIRALEIPKRLFGAARKIEDGGSLTIIATVLIDTGSRMDELIFEEFKGTGNMELVLSRDLANERIFPAIDLVKSGTRREELLFGAATEPHQALRRAISRMKPRPAMKATLRLLKMYPTNDVLLGKITGGLGGLVDED